MRGWDENYSKMDVSGLSCHSNHICRRANIPFQMHIFQNILSLPFSTIFSPVPHDCSHLAFHTKEIFSETKNCKGMGISFLLENASIIYDGQNKLHTWSHPKIYSFCPVLQKIYLLKDHSVKLSKLSLSPKKLKDGKPRIGESTLAQKVLDTPNQDKINLSVLFMGVPGRRRKTTMLNIAILIKNFVTLIQIEMDSSWWLGDQKLCEGRISGRQAPPPDHCFERSVFYLYLVVYIILQCLMLASLIFTLI